MDILQAKKEVIAAGLRLVEKGLIARTWGNVSCRVDENSFVITPSGKPYEGLTPDDIVEVKIDTLSYEGNVKPSSEKGVHAEVYKAHPEAGFVIHTHQKFASIISATMQGIPTLSEKGRKVIGDKEHTVTVDPVTSAVSGEGEIPTAELHRAIYASREDINAILYSQAPEVLAVAAMGKTVKPQLDDSAQIIGVSLKCAKNSPKKVVKALKGRHCVLVKDGGALCCGSNESNAGAVEMIAEKSCLTYIGSGLFGKCKPINPIESLLMRVIYLKKYSKQAE